MIALPAFVADAFVDSIKLVPVLIVMFFLIELSENYFSSKIKNLSNYSRNIGPLIGSLLAAVPQCGFSVVAAALYVKNYITKGTLIAVFISTSDEAIPVLLAYPDKAKAVLPLVLIKILLGVLAGYIVDFAFKSDLVEKKEPIDVEEGCCRHDIPSKTVKELILHPLKHTLNIFLFIFAVTLVLNYFLIGLGGADNLGKYLLNNSIFQPVAAAVIGLIPNCAISVLITLLYINNAISFGSTIAGLSSGAGLGLLVLIRKNKSLNDSIFLIILLFLISCLAGCLIQLY